MVSRLQAQILALSVTNSVELNDLLIRSLVPVVDGILPEQETQPIHPLSTMQAGTPDTV